MYFDYLNKIDIQELLLKIKKEIVDHKEKVTVALIMVVLTLLISLFSSGLHKKSDDIMYDIYDGKTFVTETYPVFKDVVFVGDSYSHHLALELGFDTTIYSSPGLPLADLRYCFKSAKENQKKYMVIFIGPNDYKMNTDLITFHDQLEDYVNTLKDDSKVILCSYLSSMYTNELKKFGEVKYEVSQYDSEIKKVAENNENVYYFDLNDLDGDSKYYKYNSDNTDTIHFNHDFYVEFINRLYKFIVTIG